MKPIRHLSAALWQWVGVALLSSCGGAGPLDNPPLVDNPVGQSGQKLSFAYFEKCVSPIFRASLQTTLNGVVSTSTCQGAGCHAIATGTGGAFRIVPDAAAPGASAPATIRTSDMYKNFVSAQGQVVLSDVAQSRLLTKPQLQNVLHGGGLIFESGLDPNVRLIEHWISHPMPRGQDEFSTAINSVLFTDTGACKTQ